jgi:hypothetical protein
VGESVTAVHRSEHSVCGANAELNDSIEIAG